MTAAIIPLPLRQARSTVAAEAGGVTLDQLHRAELAVRAELSPPRQSTLIAMLASDDPAVREQAIRELEARR